MNILILGGTGAMGAHLIELLDSEDNKIFVTSRSKHENTERVTYIQGNARETSFLEKTLKKPWDVIIDFMNYGTEEFRTRVDVMLNSTVQYIFLSSARVYSQTENLISENTPRLLDVSNDEEYLKTDEYALSKARQENILHNSGRENWTIIRPSITYSESRLQLGVLEKESWLFRALHGRSIIFSDDIADKLTTMTYGLDVARGISEITGNPKAYGEAFHITSTEAFRWQEILEVYLNVLEKHLGFRPKIVMVKKSPNLKFGKYQVIYSRYFNRKFDNSKINEFVDVESFLETKNALKSCLEEFLKSPSFLNINWRLEGVHDRISGEYTSLKEIPSFKSKFIYFAERFRLYFILDSIKRVFRLFK